MKTDKKVTERDAYGFKADAKKSYLNLVERLLEKSPIVYGLVRALKCLDPSNLVQYSCGKQFETVLNNLVDANVLKLRECDEVKVQFDEMNKDPAIHSL